MNKPLLSYLIKKEKFDYVNSDITDNLFTTPSDISEDYKVYHFDEDISSEDAITKMAADGYRPANAWELVNFSMKKWNGTDWVVALGSVGRVDGDRCVPDLFRDDSERGLGLGGWGGGWGYDGRFLAVRNSEIGTSESKNSAIGNSDILTLESAIQKVKAAGYVVYKMM